MASIIILKVILLKLPLENIAASLHDANEARLQLRALHTIYCTALWYITLHYSQVEKQTAVPTPL